MPWLFIIEINGADLELYALRSESVSASGRERAEIVVVESEVLGVGGWLFLTISHDPCERTSGPFHVDEIKFGL